ncbi:MAG: hypothetical protein QOC62_3906 [Mycobacterium sp.]|jgi:hypothetical protein|nr:hypothetical protein [Mycobacterium sp.]
MTDDEDMAEVYRKITGRDWTPTPPPDDASARPANDDLMPYFPWHADWWRSHSDVAPTLVLKCGIDNCNRRVGEVKTDGDIAVALLLNKFPESTLHPSVVRAMSREELERKLRKRDAMTLKRTPDGGRFTKRQIQPPTVMPLEVIGYFVCPVEGHGLILLVDPDATLAHLRGFLADTQPQSERIYLMFRESPLVS